MFRVWQIQSGAAVSNIELIEGTRWATELARSSLKTLETAGGHERLIKVLRLGLVDKPEDFKAGVVGVIRIIEDASIIRALSGRK